MNTLRPMVITGLIAVALSFDSAVARGQGLQDAALTAREQLRQVLPGKQDVIDNALRDRVVEQLKTVNRLLPAFGAPSPPTTTRCEPSACELTPVVRCVPRRGLAGLCGKTKEEVVWECTPIPTPADRKQYESMTIRQRLRNELDLLIPQIQAINANDVNQKNLFVIRAEEALGIVSLINRLGL